MIRVEACRKREVLVSAMLILAVWLALPFPYAGQTVSRDTRHEGAIREVVRKYVDARDRSDAAAIRALFTEEADQLTSSGEWRKGREEIVRGTLSSSQSSPGTRTITVETIRFPAPDVAMADGRYEIAGGPQGATRKMWTTFLMIRTGDTWRIAAIRNMLPAMPTPRAGN